MGAHAESYKTLAKFNTELVAIASMSVLVHPPSGRRVSLPRDSKGESIQLHLGPRLFSDLDLVRLCADEREFNAHAYSTRGPMKGRFDTSPSLPFPLHCISWRSVCLTIDARKLTFEPLSTNHPTKYAPNLVSHKLL